MTATTSEQGVDSSSKDDEPMDCSHAPPPPTNTTQVEIEGVSVYSIIYEENITVQCFPLDPCCLLMITLWLQAS